MEPMKGIQDKFVTAGVCILIGVILSACQQQTPAPGTMPRADMERLIKKSVEVFNTGDIEATHGIYAPDVIRHEQESVVPRVGIEKFKRQIQRIREGFSQIEMAIDDLIIENDKAVVRWTVHVVRPKPTEEDPQAVEKAAFTGITISRIEHGQIAEQWVYYDTASVLARLGYQVTPTE